MKPTPIDLARKHVGNGAKMESSARLCLEDAVRHRDEGNLRQSEQHALKSLAYSVGLFHADYVKAWKQVNGSRTVGFPVSSDFLDARESDERAANVPRYVNELTDADGVSRPLFRTVRVF